MNTQASEPAARSDLLWIGAATLLLIATGIGFRDPWPADEPRFAVIARDMVQTGNWLFPHVGGDLYQDKPPLYFWLLAVSYAAIGSLRWAFLLPSLLAASGTLLLVYDLGRKLYGRQAALVTTLVLLGTVQFLTTSRSAQIDATLMFLTTLSLYGLLRHFLCGPCWWGYCLAGFAAGLGVITKGVGFLPLLALAPYVLMRRAGWQHLAPLQIGGWRWSLAPVAFLIAIAAWLVPMLITVASRGTADLIAYRDEILLQQTVTRYAAAWHHARPWYYLLTQIPLLWFPLSFLAIWLVPRWRLAWQARDSRIWLPLIWVLLAVLFFSASSGKRGIYLTPALPALAWAAAPYLPTILTLHAVRRASIAFAGLLALASATLLTAYLVGAGFAQRALAQAGFDSAAPLWLLLALLGVALVLSLRYRPAAAWLGALGALAVVWSYVIAPSMNDERTTRRFMVEAQAKVSAAETLGLVAYKEQFLLHLTRPVVNFGHRRTGEGLQEAYDAAAWQAAGKSRVLLLPESVLEPCFLGSSKQAISQAASGETWFLLRGHALHSCIQQGSAGRAIPYSPAPP